LTREKKGSTRAKEAQKEMTTRLDVTKAPALLEEDAKHGDAFCGTSHQREGCRRDVEGLFLPSERQKTLTGFVNTEPVKGAPVPQVHALPWVLSEADGDERKRHACRLQLLREDPPPAPTSKGVLVSEETGDRTDGHTTAHRGRPSVGTLGKGDKGVVAVTSVWAGVAGL
jgi:hypothetical protein